MLSKEQREHWRTMLYTFTCGHDDIRDCLDDLDALHAKVAELEARIARALALTYAGTPEFRELAERHKEHGGFIPKKLPCWRVVEAVREVLMEGQYLHAPEITRVEKDRTP